MQPVREGMGLSPASSSSPQPLFFPMVQRVLAGFAANQNELHRQELQSGALRTLLEPGRGSRTQPE